MNSKKDYQEVLEFQELIYHILHQHTNEAIADAVHPSTVLNVQAAVLLKTAVELYTCLLYTSPSPRDKRQSRMPSSA